MKEFSLERAMAGDPLVTRAGKSAKFIALVTEADAPYRLVCHVSGESRTWGWYEDGKYESSREGEQDLFMAPKKRTVFVTLYKSGCADWSNRYEIVTRMGEGYLAGPFPQVIEE